jgi:U3 small nucleolar RNA-associated protein 14
VCITRVVATYAHSLNNIDIPHCPTQVNKPTSRATPEIASTQGVHHSSSEVTQQENPWLTVESVSGKRSRAKNEVTLGKNSDGATLSKNAMKKRLRKQAEALAQAKDDSNLEIDVNTIMSIPKTDTLNKPKRASEPTTGHHRVDATYHDDDVQEEHGLVGPRTKNGPTAFEQRELVARAFAGDNVIDVSSVTVGHCLFKHFIQEFAAEKRREMEADAPKEVDTTLPGWVRGAWPYTITTHF